MLRRRRCTSGSTWTARPGRTTLRIRAQSASALEIARFLQRHARVERVCYPGLEQDPGHAVACGQMVGFGAMVSMCFRGDARTAMAVAARARIFTRATSLGGVESLIEHRASVEGSDTLTPQNLLRLSIGLENPQDLIEDLNQALHP